MNTIEDLPLSGRLKAVLINAGTPTLEAAAQFPRKFWMLQNGCAFKTVAELEAALKSIGLSFAVGPMPDKKQLEVVGVYQIKPPPSKRKTPVGKGDVYFVYASEIDRVKIGFCGGGSIKKRMGDLQVGCPIPLTLIGLVPDGGWWLERNLHEKFKADRVCGEWFTLSHSIKEYIKENCK